MSEHSAKYARAMGDWRVVTPKSGYGKGVYIRLQGTSARTANALRDAWKRPVRHNLLIERAALWHSLDLDADCSHIMNPRGWPLLIRPMAGDFAARYEAEAAIRMIPSTLPFSADERQALRVEQRDQNYEFEYYVPSERQALFTRWHQWLWSPREALSEPAAPSHDAEILNESSARLARSLAVIVLAAPVA